MGAYGGFNVIVNTGITVNIMKLSSIDLQLLVLFSAACGQWGLHYVLSLASQAILSGLLLAILA